MLAHMLGLGEGKMRRGDRVRNGGGGVGRSRGCSVGVPFFYANWAAGVGPLRLCGGNAEVGAGREPESSRYTVDRFCS